MSQRKSSAKEGEKCGACEENVGEREAGIQCELCLIWNMLTQYGIHID